MIDIEGLILTAPDIEKIKHPNTGGVILFTRNYQDTEQLIALINSIRTARNGPILVAVDQEGGRVQRFKQGFTRLPAAACYAQTPDRADTLAEAAGWLMAAELRAVGIDFSFAPVLDVDCGISEIIGDRSFAQNPQRAAQIALAFRRGMKTAGMSAVGKHFPGHGAVAADSHLDLPVDERDLTTIRNRDFLPFNLLIQDGLEGMMPAHVIYPKVDSKPAGFSSVWIQQILRDECGFKGTVFSDDLSMQAAATAGNYVERARLALLAGCDMILVCNNPQAAEQILEATPKTDNLRRTQRLLNMMGQPALNRSQLTASARWLQASELIGNITER